MKDNVTSISRPAEMADREFRDNAMLILKDAIKMVESGEVVALSVVGMSPDGAPITNVVSRADVPPLSLWGAMIHNERQFYESLSMTQEYIDIPEDED